MSAFKSQSVKLIQNGINEIQKLFLHGDLNQEVSRPAIRSAEFLLFRGIALLGKNLISERVLNEMIKKALQTFDEATLTKKGASEIKENLQTFLSQYAIEILTLSREKNVDISSMLEQVALLISSSSTAVVNAKAAFTNPKSPFLSLHKEQDEPSPSLSIR